MAISIVCLYSRMSGQRLHLARRGVAVWTALALLWPLTACTAKNDEQIHIRIQNATDADITAFWLGAGSGAGGSGSHAYGAIARGDTTPYRRLKAQFGSYSNYNFLAASGQRYLGSVVSTDLFGQFSLAPGHYTFVITIEADVTRLEIVPDEPE